MSRPPTRSDEFFRLLPRGSLVLFMVAVFFVFAPVGLLIVSSFAQRRSAPSVIVMMIVSGLVAVSWASTFTISGKLWPTIPLMTALIIAISGPLGGTAIGVGSTRLSVTSLTIVAAIALGYTLFVVFISRQGRTTLRLMTEMSLAQQIHESLVPRMSWSDDRLELFGVSSASSEMGGDLIDLLPSERGLDLFVADVSGHGVKAGVVMGMVKSAIRMGLREQGGLDRLATALNDVLESTTTPEMYATLAALRLTQGGSELEYLLAGHHHVVVRRAARGVIERLGKAARPVGLIAGTEYVADRAQLAPGDLIAIYTDGVNETMDASDEELGHEPIERVLLQRSGEPLAELQQAIFAAADAHGPQVDDRSLVLLRLKPAGAA